MVDSFLERPLDGGPYCYLWWDALRQKVREEGRIVEVSVAVATAVNAEGKREIVGMDVGTSEDGAFWMSFLRSLSGTGLGGVELVISDAHRGLTDAIATVFAGASWQRCRNHFMANLLTQVPRSAQPWVATMVRTVYQQPSGQEVHMQLERVVDQLSDRFPEASSMLAEAGADVLALTGFPRSSLEAGVVEQPPGAVEQGDPAQDRRRGHLPEPVGGTPSGWRSTWRAARRVGSRSSLLDTRGTHESEPLPEVTLKQSTGA